MNVPTLFNCQNPSQIGIVAGQKTPSDDLYSMAFNLWEILGLEINGEENDMPCQFLQVAVETFGPIDNQ